MFGIGPMELVVILLVALLLLGPKRLPEVMKMIGRTLAELRKTADDVKKEIVQQDDLQDIQNSLREIGEVPKLVQMQLEKEVADLEREEEEKLKEPETEVKDKDGGENEGSPGSEG